MKAPYKRMQKRSDTNKVLDQKIGQAMSQIADLTDL